MHWRHVSITTTPCWGSRLVALRAHVLLAAQLAQKHYQNIIKMFGQTLWKCFGKMLKSYENVWFCNDQENIFITLDNNINKTFKTHFLNIKLWCYNNILLMLSRMFTKHINNIFTMFESYVIKMLHLYLINIWRKCLKHFFNLFLRPYILI